MKLGNTNIEKAFLGTTEIKKVMLGSNEVWLSEVPRVLTDFRLLATLSMSADVDAIAMSDDYKLFFVVAASSSSERLFMYDLNNFTELDAKLTSGISAPYNIQWHNNFLIVYSYNIDLYNVANQTLTFHSSSNSSPTISFHDKYASIFNTDPSRVVVKEYSDLKFLNNLGENTTLSLDHTIDGGDSTVYSYSMSYDESYIVVYYQYEVKVYDTATYTLQATFTDSNNTGEVICSPTENYFVYVSSTSGQMIMRDGVNYDIVDTLTIPTSGLYAFSPDGKYFVAATGSYYRDIKIYDTSDWSLIDSFIAPSTAYNRDLVFSPDGKYFAIGGDSHKVLVYEFYE